MDLIALLGADSSLQDALGECTDSSFHFHAALPDSSAEQILAALEPLRFAGAAVLDPGLQAAALGAVTRPSVAAQGAGAVDCVVVTAAGLVGEYTLGQAVGELLLASQWNLRGARGVVIGTGPEAKAVAREASGLGLNHLSVLGEDVSSAEAITRELAATTKGEYAPLRSPVSMSYIERADVLVRCDPSAEVPTELLGPHLSVVDLSPAHLSHLREAALKVGAKSLGARDVWAYQLMLIARQVLGRHLEAAPFLELFHSHIS